MSASDRDALDAYDDWLDIYVEDWLDDLAGSEQLDDPIELEELACVVSAPARDADAPVDSAALLAGRLQERGDVAAATLLEAIAILVPRCRPRARESLSALAAGGIEADHPPGLGGGRVASCSRIELPARGALWQATLERSNHGSSQSLLITLHEGGRAMPYSSQRPERQTIAECLVSGPLEHERPEPAVNERERYPGERSARPHELLGALREAARVHREESIPVRWGVGLRLPVLGLACGDDELFDGIGILAEGADLSVEPDDSETFERVRKATLGDFEEWLALPETTGVTPDHALDVARCMLEMQWEHDGRLAHWTLDDIEWFLLKDAPRRLGPATSADAVAASAAAFVRFLSESALLSGDPWPTLEELCEQLRVHAASVAGDRSRWGPAKSMASEMLAENVDLSDPEAVSEWTEEFNSRSQAERDRVVGPSVDRRLARDVGGEDAELPNGVDSSVLPQDGGAAIGLCWFSSQEYGRALERWSELGELWQEIPHEQYVQRMEATMRGWRSRGLRPRPVRLALDAYELWCADRGVSPDDSRAAYAADQLRVGNAYAWPPGRNEPCWCGSERKYKRCCGLVTASVLHPLEAEL